MRDDDRRMPQQSAEEAKANLRLAELSQDSPIPAADRLDNLALYLRPQVFSLQLGLAEIYSKILEIHGVIFDLGTRYGRNMATFSSLRRIYEPYNHFRRIIGFDTFSGLPAIGPEDGDAAAAYVGGYSVPIGYEEHLAAVLRCHEDLSPLGHISRFELRSGDARQEVPGYLEEHPETVVALAYFDMDLHGPTREVLEAILPHTTQGTVLVFDEPTHPRFPGETVAIKEVLGLRNHSLRRSPHRGHPAYVVLN